MKKNFRTLILPGLALLISAIFLFQGYPSISSKSFSRSRTFSYPDLISLDNSGNTFIVENGWKQITKLDSAGEIVFSIEGGKRSAGFYEAWNISADSTGYFYILNSIRDIETGYVLNEQIIRYTPNGVKERIIEDFSYTKSSVENNPALSFGRIISMKVIGDSLCYLYRTDKGPELRIINITSAKKLPAVMLRNMPLIVDFTLHNNSIYVTQKNGQILKYSMEGKLLPFTISGSNLNNPYTIWTNNNGILLYSDIGLRKLMFSKETSAGTAFDINNYSRLQQKPKDFLIRNFAASPQGEIAFIDDVNSRITVLNPDFSIKKTFDKAVFKPASVIIIILFLFFLTTAILTLAYFLIVIFHFFIYTRFRLLTKFAAVWMILNILTYVLIGKIGFDETFKQQDKATIENLKQMSAIMASTINADALKRINQPANYLNSDYIALQKQLCSLIATDNSGLYALLYKEYDGKLYYTVDMTGYYGTKFPYTKAQAVHFDALKGKTGNTVYNDYEGEWVISVSPVRDSSDKIVGILEVGTNHFVEKELRSAFFQRINFKVLILLIITSILTVLSFYYLLSPLHKITRFISSIGKNEKETEIHINSGDEFQTLASGINTITGKLFTHLSEVQEKTSRLENHDSVKEIFITNTVRELKTPLNGITGITESIISQSGDTVSKKVKSDLSLILLSTKRLSSLINDILNFSDSRREMKLDLAPLDLSEVVSRVRSVFLFSSAEKEITIDYEPAEVQEIQADRMKIEKVLFSIIGYVLSMSRENHCAVAIKTKGLLEIEISGVNSLEPEEVFKQLFLKNENDQNLIIENDSEYLCELAAAKTIIQMHKGSIAMLFQNGILTFTVKIPA